MFNIQDWSKKFISLGKEPMNEQLSMVFMNMMLQDDDKNFKAPELEGQFLYQVISKRAEHMGIEISVPATIFLMFLTQSPGSAVMYLSALRSQKKLVNMNVIADMFPMGFVSAKDMETMWDAQKGHIHQQKVDNCLDVQVYN